MTPAAPTAERPARAVRCIDRELLLDVASGDVDRTIALAAALECILTPVVRAITGEQVPTASGATAAIRDLPRWAAIGRTEGEQVLDPAVTVGRALRSALAGTGVLPPAAGRPSDQQLVAMLRGAGLSVAEIARLMRLPLAEVTAAAEGTDATSIPREVARRLRDLRPAPAAVDAGDGATDPDAEKVPPFFDLEVRIPVSEVLPRALARELGVDPQDAGWLGAMLQPIVDLSTGTTVAEELLVRWVTPQGQVVPTERWISLAEHAGLLGDLAVWTIATAVTQAADGERPVAVNVTPGQLTDPRLLATIVDALTSARQPAASLRLELTETARVQDIPSARRTVCDLHDLGIALDLDDFGTGYSSITYLRDLPIDGFKLDRSYVGDLGLRQNATAIVRGLLELGRALELTVTAEGIERQEQLDELRLLGCERGQGYLFSTPRPLPARPAVTSGAGVRAGTRSGW